MKTTPMLALTALFLASFLIAPIASADPCINAVAHAAHTLDLRGGQCRRRGTAFKEAAPNVSRSCGAVRDKIRACWKSYRSTKSACDKIRKLLTRSTCIRYAQSTRNKCIRKLFSSSAKKTCSSKRKFAAKTGFRAGGACGAPVFTAEGTCVAYWTRALTKAVVGG